jgi:hypothetical protein
MLGVISRRDVHNADNRKADNLMTPSIQETGTIAMFVLNAIRARKNCHVWNKI